MKITKNFAVEISSNLDYEEMVANILYKEETVAIISQEKGIEKLEIELFEPVDERSWRFSLEDFLSIIHFAKKRLIEMQKLPEE